MQKTGQKSTLWFILVFLFLINLFAIPAHAAEHYVIDQSWTDNENLVKITRTGDLTHVYFNLPIWAEMYDIWSLKDGDDETLGFRAGPFPISGLEGEIKDVLIFCDEVFNWYDYTSLPTPAVFFLLEDGTVDFMQADLYDTVDYGFYWEPEFFTFGILPLLPTIQSIHYDGVAYGLDSEGSKFNLSYAIGLKFLTEGYWVAELVAADGDAGGINGYLKFRPNGELVFEAMAEDYDLMYKQSYEIWSGSYSLILKEEEAYSPGTLFVDLRLNWWIWESDGGDLGPNEYQAIYHLGANAPWYLELELLDGRSLYPYPGAKTSYTFWVEFSDDEDDESLPWQEKIYAMDFVDYSNKEDVLAFLADDNSINSVNAFGQTPLILALNEGAPLEIIRLLIAKGAELDVSDNEGVTPLFAALWSEADREVILLLLESGVNVNQEHYGSIPLLSAILYDYDYNVIQTFIKSGANPHDEEYDNYTTLMFAALNYHETAPQIIKLLLNLGVKIDKRDSEGATALHYAASGNRNPEVIKTLVQGGASLNLRDIDGYTPLMYAAVASDNPEIIRTLLDLGADGKLKSEEGKTAFEYALENEYLKTTDELWLLNEARF